MYSFWGSHCTDRRDGLANLFGLVESTVRRVGKRGQRRLANREWRSVDDLSRAYVARLIVSEPAALDEQTLSRIAANLYRYDRARIVLIGINALLVAYLLANIGGVTFNLELFGTAVGSRLPIREIVLLLSAYFGLMAFGLQATVNFLSLTLELQTAKTYPKIGVLATLQHRRFLPRAQSPIGDEEMQQLGLAQRSLRALSIICLNFAVIILGVILVAVHIYILFDMWENPQIPIIFNRLIIAVVILGDVGTFSANVFLHVRLPIRANNLSRG